MQYNKSSIVIHGSYVIVRPARPIPPMGELGEWVSLARLGAIVHAHVN